MASDAATEMKNSMEYKTEHSCSEASTCKQCKQDGLVIPEVAFCVECQDYLCPSCSNHHRSARLSTKDMILKGNEMQKNKASIFVSESSSSHTGETDKFYCETHDEICCCMCTATEHSTCDIKALNEVAKDYSTSEKFAETNKELKTLKDLFRKKTDEIEKEMKTSSKSVQVALSELNKHRNDINKHFDELEKEIKNEAMSIHTEDSRKLHNLAKACASALEDIEEMQAKLSVLGNTNQEQLLFAEVQNNKKKIDEMIPEINRIQAETAVRALKFCHSRTSTSMTVRKDLLGYLKVYEGDNVGKSRSSSQKTEEKRDGENKGKVVNEDEKQKGEREKEEDKKENKDESREEVRDHALANVFGSQYDWPCGNCETGKTHFDCKLYQEVALPKLLHMSEKFLTILDYHKNKISLHSKGYRDECASVIFSSSPWDMAKMETNMIAVTFPHEKKIKILCVDNGIEEIDEISSPGFCRSIASICNNLVVTFTNPVGLKLLSKSGEILKDIPMTDNGKVLFRAPSSVATADKNIYVTDPVLNTVTRMDSDGKTEQILQMSEFTHPSFVSVSNERLLVSLSTGFNWFSMNFDFTNIHNENDEEHTDLYCTNTQVTDFNTIAFHGIGSYVDNDNDVDNHDDIDKDDEDDGDSERRNRFSNTYEVGISSDNAEEMQRSMKMKGSKEKCAVS